MGRSPLSFLHPEYAQDTTTMIRQSLETGKPLPPVEHRMLSLDGAVIEVEISASDLEGLERDAMQLVIRDITSCKQLEAPPQLD